MKRTKYNTVGGKSLAEEEWKNYMFLNCKELMIWQKKFVIQEKFTMGNGEKIKEITFTPDMYFPKEKYFVDFKGMISVEYKIKKKMLQFIYDIDGIELGECPKYLQINRRMIYATPQFIDEVRKAKSALGISGSPDSIRTNKIIKKLEEKFIIQYNEKYLYWYLIKR